MQSLSVLEVISGIASCKIFCLSFMFHHFTMNCIWLMLFLHELKKALVLVKTVYFNYINRNVSVKQILLTCRPITKGGQGCQAPLKKFFSPLEKCVGLSLKLLHIVQKIWAPLRKLFAPLVSQAGYVPAHMDRRTKRGSPASFKNFRANSVFRASASCSKILKDKNISIQ